MALAKVAQLRIKNTDFSGDDKLILTPSHWDYIYGKPTSYNPAVHEHSISEITDLQNKLNLKADVSDVFQASVNRPARTFLAAPNNTTGKPTFRNITRADIPNVMEAPAILDSTMTTTNFRTKIFGSTANDYRVTVGRWNESKPSFLDGMSNYSNIMTFSGADTHGFLAVNYNAPGVKVGGGSGNNINWSEWLVTRSELGNYADRFGSPTFQSDVGFTKSGPYQLMTIQSQSDGTNFATSGGTPVRINNNEIFHKGNLQFEVSGTTLTIKVD